MFGVLLSGSSVISLSVPGSSVSGCLVIVWVVSSVVGRTVVLLVEGTGVSVGVLIVVIVLVLDRVVLLSGSLV